MTSLIMPETPEEPAGPEPVEAPISPAEALIEDPTPEPEPDMFPRSYVEELRREAAGYRTKAKSYDDAFDGMDDDTREAWLEYTALVVRAQSGDQAAIDRIQEMFADDEDDTPDIPEPVIPAQDPIAAAREEARRAAEEVYQEREQARMQEEQILAVRKAGEDLGYNFGTDDYILFVRGANEAANSGDDDPIAAGDRAVKAYRQAVVDAYLKAKGEQAESTAPVPDGGGAAPNLSKQPYDPASSEMAKWNAVRDSAMARFRQ
jgi:hypothetical protein